MTSRHASDDEYQEYDSSDGLSSEFESRPASRRSSTQIPSWPRASKRRRSRSDSVDSLPNSKRHLHNEYNDAYRTLFNEHVTSAAKRFVPDSYPLHRSQIGVSKWSSEEKSIFFAAIEKLGRDDLPGISKAVQTKSIPEVRNFLLLLHDASTENSELKVNLSDIPAATELSTECCERLELASDALSWYQERFEAKQEQDRYGDHWLITPEIAGEIENAIRSSRAASASSSLAPDHDGTTEDAPFSSPNNSSASEIVEHTPESNLLKIDLLLRLSKSFFMNCSPTYPSLYPHWTALTSPLASSPSIYHTALTDLHTLVLSLTKRLTQACIIQATSRIRSQSWRTRSKKWGLKKAASLLVRKRDVLAVLVMLRLPRNGQERWRSVARRCGLRVFDGVGKGKRELEWDEVEKLLGFSRESEIEDTDGETSRAASGTEDSKYKSRARRGATPLPTGISMGSVTGSDNDFDDEYEGSKSDTEYSESDQTPQFSAPNTPKSPAKPSRNQSDIELNTALEDIDRYASRQEELRLWSLLGTALRTPKIESLEREEDPESLGTKMLHKELTSIENWRDWTEYRAEWEEYRKPVSEAKFRANQRQTPSTATYISAASYGTDVTADTDQDSNSNSISGYEKSKQRAKRRKVLEQELPIRGARAYAALQERRSDSLQQRCSESVEEMRSTSSQERNSISPQEQRSDSFDSLQEPRLGPPNRLRDRRSNPLNRSDRESVRSESLDRFDRVFDDVVDNILGSETPMQSIEGSQAHDMGYLDGEMEGEVGSVPLSASVHRRAGQYQIDP
ncbi:hypothetical protein K469DRAFT_715125 [Zopfia rhizophila CBS 207.26]|uniref:Myb-like domain-containing protein n=1 Tax=Zopfia rhizophila CBS 207.26 TaxID=1314779 RepID=A0A6A6ELN8_9PEZI|nr:hypothetical protein K469DRAFT_715125 [Zopfia rhizophila CBS 207.26]